MQQHSKIGIASFILSLVANIASVVLFVGVGFLGALAADDFNESSVLAIVIGLAFVGLLFLDIVALILGIASLFQQNRNKFFAIMGTAFSVTLPLGVVSLIAIGNRVSDQSSRPLVCVTRMSRGPRSPLVLVPRHLELLHRVMRISS
ncbi:MAG: hypothetical protein AAFQ89_05870 [Cyanobacteria bacterium J06626_18]